MRESITEQWSILFESRVRTRGKRYFLEGRVTSFDWDETCVDALVRGSEIYRVSIEYMDEAPIGWELSCTCPYAETNFCKHQWAVLLSLEETGVSPESDAYSEDAQRSRPGRSEVLPILDEAKAEDLLTRSAEFAVQKLNDMFQDEQLEESKPDWLRRLERLPESPSLAAVTTDSEQWVLRYLLESPTLFDNSFSLGVLGMAPEHRAGGAEDASAEQPSHWQVLELTSAGLRLKGAPIDRSCICDEDLELIDLWRSVAIPKSAWDHNSGVEFHEASRPGELEAWLAGPPLLDLVLRRVQATGRAWVDVTRAANRRAKPIDILTGGRLEAEPLVPLNYVADVNALFRLDVSQSRKQWVFDGEIVLEGIGKSPEKEQVVPLEQVCWFWPVGLMALADGRVVRASLAPEDAAWLRDLMEFSSLEVPSDGSSELFEIVGKVGLPAVNKGADALSFSDVLGVPVPHVDLQIRKSGFHYSYRFDDTVWRIASDLSFDYGERRFGWDESELVSVDVEARQRVRRDLRREARYREELLRALPGERRQPDKPAQMLHETSYFNEPNEIVVRLLQALGPEWHLRVGGRPVIPVEEAEVSVSSGLDWFQVNDRTRLRAAHWDSAEVALPDLLSAASSGKPIASEAGDYYVMPGQRNRLRALDSLLRSASAAVQLRGQHRLSKAQLLVVEAILSGSEGVEISFDAQAEELRKALREFRGVKSVKSPRGFKGALRGYQRDGLGWLWFLRTHGLGGCLADDMGLGKTVQVLALLQSIRTRETRKKRRPFLVVAPKSVVSNWVDEARRFTPSLQVIEYSGKDRHGSLDSLIENPDRVLIVTNYQLMRMDIEYLNALDYDVVVMDEAQAIKNPNAVTSMAAGRLSAKQRIALTGTPVENRLSDVASIFRFLNPGMVENLPSLRALVSEDESSKSLEIASSALRPLILRRTKEEVLSDLPPKTEQSLYCDLSPAERRRYDQLAVHYRNRFRKDQRSTGRKRFEVLEALLRLRQSACHQGLIDAKIVQPSAKLKMLCEKVSEALDVEGSKVLVFSSFTQLLSRVRDQFEQRGWQYAYLDGSTTRRKEVVNRFQTDPDCRIFLISLKAGGTGLNLTAADYVFLLDPWWNPAVERQAVDRAHRIGQERAVLAYRLLARDTVEDRILELQDKKRALADTLLGEDKSMIAKLTKDDIDRLLS